MNYPFFILFLILSCPIILFNLLIVIESVAQTQTYWSPVVWRATSDTLSITMSYDDSIPAVERYMLFSVVKSLSPDSSQLLWSINENDSMMYGVFTDGNYNKHSGFIHKQTNLDFSQWKVFVYQQGCATDTNKQYSLHIGALDSVPSNIMIPEYLFFSSTMKLKQKMAIQTYLAIKYGIMSIPTFLVFKDGKVSQTAVGMRDKEELITLIEK